MLAFIINHEGIRRKPKTSKQKSTLKISIATRLPFRRMLRDVLQVISGRTTRLTDRGRRRRDTTGHDGADGEGIQYSSKSISMVYPSKSTRTEFSGLAKESVSRCASFRKNIYFIYTIFVTYIYIYIYCYIYIVIYIIYNYYKICFKNICL